MIDDLNNMKNGGKGTKFNVPNFKQSFDNTQSTAASGQRTNPMNSMRGEHDFNNEYCSCNGSFQKGFYIHDERCPYEEAINEEDEMKVDQMIEDFR